MKKIYELQEVFVPVGLPDLTFVKRVTLERAIKSWEINQHKHLLIFGASKTGKTSLWKRYVAPEKVIKIPCNYNTNINSLYKEILQTLGAFFIQSESFTSGQKSSLLAELKAIIPFIGSGKIQANIEQSDATTTEKEFVREDINASMVIKFLKEAKKVIVLEDFHYTSDEFRRHLSEDLKAFSDEKCPWIIVGVQHKTSNLLTFNIDLSQRIAEIPVENFNQDQLLELMQLGELALNIKFSDEVKKMIINESNGSASILQNICQRVCMINSIYKTSDSEIHIDRITQIAEACREIADENRSFYEKAFIEISKGGRSDGSTEKYKWFLKMVSEKNIPANGLRNTDVFHILQEMGHKGIDQSSVTAGLKYLPKLLIKSNLPALLDYDDTNKSFYLLDDYMKFVVKWIPGIIDSVFDCELREE